MALFKSSDIIKKESPKVHYPEDVHSMPFNGVFYTGEKKNQIASKIGILKAGTSIFYETQGSWSNIELLEYLLEQTGKSEIYFSTWSISEEAIRRFSIWNENNRITNIYAVVDAGLRNRKPAIYQSAIATFKNIKFSHSHAKVTVIKSDSHAITLITSANYTKNPRQEVGIIVFDEKLAEKNIQWILREIYGRDR